MQCRIVTGIAYLGHALTDIANLNHALAFHALVIVSYFFTPDLTNLINTKQP